MSSTTNEALVKRFAPFADEIDITVEEFVDFLTKIPVNELAEIVTIAVTFPDTNYEGKVSRVLTDGIVETVSTTNLLPTTPELRYELGKRLLVSPYERVRGIGIYMVLDHANAAPEEELTQLIIDALYHPGDSHDIWYRILEERRERVDCLPIRVTLRVLPHLQRVIQLHQQQDAIREKLQK